jgi:hypothetical protein
VKSFLASDFALERSPEARALAEEALLRLLAALEGQHPDIVVLVVLGGLVPEILTRGQANLVPQHLGTTDVDIHVSFLTESDHDFSSLETALAAATFEPDTRYDDGWHWRIRIDRVPVKVEFLCDQTDVAANQVVLLPGCNTLAAANLRGTGFVARDWVEEPLSGTIDGRPISVTAKYAGLEGYLMAKAYAVRHRGDERDYYDLVFVLLYNRAGGPAQAADLLREGKFAQDVRASRSMFREIEGRFVDPAAFGPTSYSRQALRVQPESDGAQLRQDAVSAVAEFISGLRLE